MVRSMALPLAAAGLAAVAFVGPVARSAPAPRVALRGAREVPETQDGEQSPLRVGGALLSMMAAFALALLPVQEETRDSRTMKKPVGGAFGIFLAENRAALVQELPQGSRVTAVTKLAGERWRVMKEDARRPYQDKFQRRLCEYKAGVKGKGIVAKEQVRGLARTKCQNVGERKAREGKGAKRQKVDEDEEAQAAKSGGRIGGSASAARARPPPARAPAAASSSRTTVINKTTVIAPPPVMAPAPVAIGMAPVVVAPAPSLGDVVVGSVIGGAINNAMYGGHHSSGPSTSDRMLENQQRQDERQMDKQSMEIEQLKSELANLKK